MSAPIPYDEPARLVAGDTAKWLKSLGDYPASEGWQLSYTLVSATQRYTFTASPQDDEHLVNVSAVATGSYVPGNYTWRARVTLGGEVYTVGQGPIEVAAAFAAATDGRSTARRQLDAVEAVLEGRATSAVAEYTIGGRSLKYMGVPDLLQLRDRLRIDVAREDAATRAAAGLPQRGRVVVRWGR